MKILAIDTSLATGTVAAAEHVGDTLRIEERPLGQPGEHARRLMPTLTEAAAALSWKTADAELVAVVRGPGSFTGLRVGVATAKALCWATGARLIGMSGFELVAVRSAAAIDVGGAIAVAFDAGRGDVHAAWVTRDAASPSGWVVGQSTLVPIGTWLDSLPKGSWASGPAVDSIVEVARDRGIAIPPPESRLPSAAEAARIALARFASGEADDPRSLVPEYSRPSYADEKPIAPSG